VLSTNCIIITFNNLCTKSRLQKFGIANKKKDRFIKYKIYKSLFHKYSGPREKLTVSQPKCVQFYVSLAYITHRRLVTNCQIVRTKVPQNDCCHLSTYTKQFTSLVGWSIIKLFNTLNCNLIFKIIY